MLVLAANQTLIAIRNTGATNLVLVPGVAWTGGWSWEEANMYGTPNSVVMATVRDPGNNMAFEIHQYLDGDSSGTNPNCVE
jgi:endoglucanase